MVILYQKKQKHKESEQLAAHEDSLTFISELKQKLLTNEEML